MPHKPKTYQFDLFANREEDGGIEDAALANAADGDAPDHHDADDPADPRLRRQGKRRRTARGGAP